MDEFCRRMIEPGVSSQSASQLFTDDEKIWRYLDLGEFVTILQNGSLYVCIDASLNGGHAAADRSSFAPVCSPSRGIRMANCWHVAKSESAAMWPAYSGNGQGVAIQSSLRALRAAFPQTAEDVLSKTPAVVLRIDVQSGERPPASVNACGMWVRCDIKTLIQGVVIDPKAPSDFETTVRVLVERFGLNPSLVRSSQLREAAIPRPVHALRCALMMTRLRLI